MATVGEFYIKTADEIRDDGLRTLKAGLIRAGISNPNVAPGSDYYLLFQAIADELEPLYANLQIKADQQMPDTATGEELDRWLAAVNLTRREAAGSTGNVTLTCSATTTIVVDTELLDGAGLRYKVSVGGIYANGATVPIEAIDTGTDTNLAAASVLRWVTAPPYCAETVVVASGGLTGAADAEDDDTARRRLLRKLGTPPGSGNWSHVVEIAEASSPMVQAAWCYPSLQGAGTVHVAVAAIPSETNKTRAISSTTVTNIIDPYISGLMPEHADITVTTVSDSNTDVAIYLGLPASPSAPVPGPGGGWLDGTPYPRPISGEYFCDVTAVTSTTVFKLSSNAAPTAGASRICWLSPYDWNLYTATVLSVSGPSPANEWTITIDKPFTGIAVGCHISPACANAQKYFDAILQSFALMGPGEKSDDATVVARAYRRPTPQSQWPYSLGPEMLKALTDSGDEVMSADYAYRSQTTPTAIAAGSETDPPNILVPRHISILERIT